MKIFKLETKIIIVYIYKTLNKKFSSTNETVKQFFEGYIMCNLPEQS